MRSSLNVDAVIALPELYAPAVPGVATSAERGFITVDQYGAVSGLSNVYAAGDITDTPVKHGGLSAEQAVVAAQAIAALAGAAIEPRPLRPALHVMLLGAAEAAVHPLADAGRAWHRRRGQPRAAVEARRQAAQRVSRPVPGAARRADGRSTALAPG